MSQFWVKKGFERHSRQKTKLHPFGGFASRYSEFFGSAGAEPSEYRQDALERGDEKMCEWERKVNAYWDNELADDEAKEVAEHLRNCVECQSALKSLQRIRQLLLQENLPAIPIAIEMTLERLRNEGAFRMTKWRRLLLQFDSWLMRPKVAFRAAMAVSLVSALILANLSTQISQATERFQGRIQKAIQSLSMEQIWQRFVSLIKTSQTGQR